MSLSKCPNSKHLQRLFLSLSFDQKIKNTNKVQGRKNGMSHACTYATHQHVYMHTHTAHTSMACHNHKRLHPLADSASAFSTQITPFTHYIYINIHVPKHTLKPVNQVVMTLPPCIRVVPSMPLQSDWLSCALSNLQSILFTSTQFCKNCAWINSESTISRQPLKKHKCSPTAHTSHATVPHGDHTNAMVEGGNDRNEKITSFHTASFYIKEQWLCRIWKHEPHRIAAVHQRHTRSHTAQGRETSPTAEGKNTFL